jgi:hypothetical protein
MRAVRREPQSWVSTGRWAVGRRADWAPAARRVRAELARRAVRALKVRWAWQVDWEPAGLRAAWVLLERAVWVQELAAPV